MAKDYNGEERIEELLGQLQGIFSKLSTSEVEESKQKLTPPPVEKVPKPVEPPTPPPIASAPPVVSTPPIISTPPLTLHTEEPIAPLSTSKKDIPPLEIEPTLKVVPFSEPVNTPIVAKSPIDKVAETTPNPLPIAEIPVDTNTESVADAIGVAIAYPEGREAELKILAEKLPTLSPKFTKVLFKLAVRFKMVYKPKTEWTDTFVTQGVQANVKAFFVLVDRPLEDAKRKTMIAALEKHGMYFQDVPLNAVEKKAFYTDLLLGLVFFFDTQKPLPADDSQASAA